MKNPQFLALFIVGVLPLSSAQASSMNPIDYSKSYACEVQSTEFEVNSDGETTSPERESRKTTITFDVQDDFVFVETTSESQPIKWDVDDEGKVVMIPDGPPSTHSYPSYVLPNHENCENIFEVKEMVFNLHMIATGFQRVACEKWNLAAQYFVSYPFSGVFFDVDLEPEGDGFLMTVREIEPNSDGVTVMKNETYQCEAEESLESSGV